MVVCLDEVRLYLGKEPDRVTELQAIAQAVKTIGQGKVLLIVTGQESPEDVDSRFFQPDADIGILTDRFPEKFRLSENNIDYVVCERLLRKSSSGPQIDSLRALIAANRPQLSTAACIRNTMQNPSGRFTNTEPAVLERYYPLLPYHVILLQEVLTRLRATGPSGGVVGTKRGAISLSSGPFSANRRISSWARTNRNAGYFRPRLQRPGRGAQRHSSESTGPDRSD